MSFLVNLRVENPIQIGGFPIKIKTIILPYDIMITTNYILSYFGFNFVPKSTQYCKKSSNLEENILACVKITQILKSQAPQGFWTYIVYYDKLNKKN